MSDPYISEIRLMSFSFPPKGWAFANGQLMSINQNQTLFSLLGTTYGGDGRTTFQLPNLQGRVPISSGAGYVIGQFDGHESQTLAVAEVPAHTHSLSGKAATAATGAPGRTPGPTKALAESAVESGSNPAVNIYGTGSSSMAFAPNAIGPSGGQSHENRQPYLVLNFCIALQGIYPPRS